ncbi:MAG: Alpha/beta hydrolase fold [Frankiales bacterium]|nr:Alpha/beta hydrolase fold [Frankiales bacterium]
MRDPRPTLAAAGRSTRRGLRTVISPAGLRGAGTEIAWITAHLALYPLGIGAGKAGGLAREDQGRFTLGDLPPLQRGLLMGDVVAAGTPILLVHGLVDNRSIFTLLRRALRRRGFGRVITLNYSPLTQDIRSVSARLAALVEKTCEETGYERVHVVGHSLGGVVARYYVQRMGGDARVHTLCTLGTPHAGTHAAKLWPGGVVRQLRPGSELMQELAAPAPGCRTRFVAFWSDLDQLIVPQHAAAIDHPDLQARNIALHGVGHMSLPISGSVVHEIATLLAHLDEDGRTQTAGVTTLTLTEAGPVPAPPERAHQTPAVAPA